jgi:hypothetical protein
MGVTKEKAGCWTRRRAFAQVRQGPNIQLLPYPLVLHHTFVACALSDQNPGDPHN